MAAPGCAFLIDADQARVCRTALPAIEPAGSRIEVIRLGRGPSPDSIRIDYRAGRAGEPTRNHVATCSFGRDSPAVGRPDLIRLARDRGEISGAALYLLKRYYLDTPEGVAAEPAANPLPALPALPRGLAYLGQQLLVGLPRTAIYGLLATSYALVFGLVGRVNLAAGEIAAIGAAAAGLIVAGLSYGGLTAALPAVLLGLLAALFAAALHGLAAGRVAFGLIPPSRAQASLVATVGLSLALSEYLRLAGGAVPDWIPPLGGDPVPLARAEDFVLTVTPVSLVTGLVGSSAALALLWLMRRSRFGRDWRAFADDARAAAMFGIDGSRLLTVTLLVAGAAAGLAGALVAVQFGALGYAAGFGLGLKALAASILGGIGSVPGALVGGVAIGLFETLWSAYLPIEGRDIALYAVLVLTIIARPDGLFGIGSDRQSSP